jgi:hypothetical protein
MSGMLQGVFVCSVFCLFMQADAGGFIKLQALRLRTLGVNRYKNV